jgi:hypothetical protein
LRNLSADDVLKALVQIKRENGPLEYNVARSVAYTILTGQERYEQLDGTYYKEHFDFLAETHTAIADALRGIISDDIPRMMARAYALESD